METTTDQIRLLTHHKIIGKLLLGRRVACYVFNVSEIGEDLRTHYEHVAECEKQRAIRSTEEVVRREERQRYEILLEATTEETREEKEKLLQDANVEKQEAILYETASLTNRLKIKYSADLANLQQESEVKLQKTIKNTWEQAEKVKQKAIQRAREEEQQVAAKEAERVLQAVLLEKQRALTEAEEEKQGALSNQKEQLQMRHTSELVQLEKELSDLYDTQLNDVCASYDSDLLASDLLLKEREEELKQLNSKLEGMKEQRQMWELKYDNLKIEFSDFIDQVPGFKAEFMLK